MRSSLGETGDDRMECDLYLVEGGQAGILPGGAVSLAGPLFHVDKPGAPSAAAVRAANRKN